MAARRIAPQRKALAALYAQRPSGFVAARKEAVAEARKTSPARATFLAAVRKPTPVLWAVNALAREADRELARHLASGETMRKAQAATVGGDARALTTARTEQRALLNRLVERAGAILAREGGHPSRAHERRIRSTLQAAALADDEVQDALLAGALDHELDASSIDLMGALAAGAVAAPRRTQTAAPEKKPVEEKPVEKKSVARAAAQRARKEARAAAQRAKAAARIERDASALERRAADLEQRAERLRARAQALRG